MRAKNWLAITLFLSLSHAAEAFDKAKCFNQREHIGSDFFSVTTTLGQFTSSTGGCAALGIRDQRNDFIIANESSLLNDISRGSGEHISTLATLDGCSANQQFLYIEALRKNLPLFSSPQGQIKIDTFDELTDAICRRL